MKHYLVSQSTLQMARRNVSSQLEVNSQQGNNSSDLLQNSGVFSLKLADTHIPTQVKSPIDRFYARYVNYSRQGRVWSG